MSLELKSNENQPSSVPLVDELKNTTMETPTMESPQEIMSEDYSTGFCTTAESCKKSMGKIIGILIILFAIYYFFMYSSLLAPFAKGIFKLFKYFILYTMIVSTILFFIHILGYLYWWLDLFYWAVERMINPLKDNTTSSWYYYLSDYINWIIYGGATIYFFLCVFGLFLLLTLIILPFVSFVGFLIGYMFSMMGEAPCSTSIYAMIKHVVVPNKKPVTETPATPPPPAVPVVQAVPVPAPPPPLNPITPAVS